MVPSTLLFALTIMVLEFRELLSMSSLKVTVTKLVSETKVLESAGKKSVTVGRSRSNESTLMSEETEALMVLKPVFVPVLTLVFSNVVSRPLKPIWCIPGCL